MERALTPGYPVDVQVAPAVPQSRLTVFFRILMVLPHLVALGVLGFIWQFVILASWFAILFTGKLPQGMANFSAGGLHWTVRAYGYMWLLTGEYPPFEMGDRPNYPVRMVIEPQLDARNRLTTFFRYVLILPHAFVLYVLIVLAQVVMLVAWVVALVTGTVPEGMHNFLAGATRYYTRVYAYGLLLVDEYPPFGLN